MPRVVDHQQRRADLALLTLEVIRTVGIENTTIREIARRGRLSMGKLTHYFTSKDELVAFAFRWLSEKSLAELDQLAATHGPGLPRLEVAVDTMSKVGEPAGIGLWLSLWDRAVRVSAFTNEHRAFYERWRGYVRTCLRDAVALQQIARGTSIDRAADLIVAAVDGLWIGGAFEPARFAPARRRSLLRLQIDALTRAPASRARRHAFAEPSDASQTVPARATR